MFINIHTHFKSTADVSIRQWEDQLPANEYFSCGIHPWEAAVDEEELNKINLLASHKHCLAIGEIGFDNLKGPDLSIQRDIFLKQLAIAENYQLPVIIHCVRAWNELKAIRSKDNSSIPWIYHGFNKASLLDEVCRADLYISIGASVLTNESLRKVIANIPENRLFCETDTSDCTIEDVYKEICALKKISLSALEQIIQNNAKQVFKRWTIG